MTDPIIERAHELREAANRAEEGWPEHAPASAEWKAYNAFLAANRGAVRQDPALEMDLAARDGMRLMDPAVDLSPDQLFDRAEQLEADGHRLGDPAMVAQARKLSRLALDSSGPEPRSEPRTPEQRLADARSLLQAARRLDEVNQRRAAEPEPEQRPDHGRGH